MIATPPMPTRFIASRSAVMPLLVILPLSQNQNTQGRAESGGWRKFFSRLDEDSAAWPALTNARLSEMKLNSAAEWNTGTVGFSIGTILETGPGLKQADCSRRLLLIGSISFGHWNCFGFDAKT